jgi:alkylated DNA repair dioxygenase AlkB
VKGELFGTHTGPPGFVYQTDYISAHEESALLEKIARLPFEEARYRDYTARRRIVNFGPGEAKPDFLQPLIGRIADWLGVDAAELRQVLINEYRTGTPLGWHRDSPEYNLVAGVSLGAPCRMRFRPFPPRRRGATTGPILSLELAPRSAYQLCGDVRWRWQHSVPPTKALRYSITFRTLAV